MESVSGPWIRLGSLNDSTGWKVKASKLFQVLALVCLSQVRSCKGMGGLFLWKAEKIKVPCLRLCYLFVNFNNSYCGGRQYWKIKNEWTWTMGPDKRNKEKMKK